MLILNNSSSIILYKMFYKTKAIQSTLWILVVFIEQRTQSNDLILKVSQELLLG